MYLTCAILRIGDDALCTTFRFVCAGTLKVQQRSRHCIYLSTRRKLPSIENFLTRENPRPTVPRATGCPGALDHQRTVLVG